MEGRRMDQNAAGAGQGVHFNHAARLIGCASDPSGYHR